MNKPLEVLWDVVEKTTNDSLHVFVNEEEMPAMRKIAEQIKALPEASVWGIPAIFKDVRKEDQLFYVLQYELLASAVNYQYWYGRPNIRPGDAGSTKMYKLLDDSWLMGNYKEIAELFVYNMSINRFPLMEMRAKHVNEVVKSEISYRLSDYIEDNEKLEDCLDELLMYCPGFADDILLKRASLLFMMLYRRMGVFASDMNKLPIPADYQVPKMLEGLGCLRYSTELKEIIKREDIIPSGSRMECEIRTGAIRACKMLSELSGRNSSDVDNYLWLKRKEITTPFHLTVTSHY